MSPDQCLCVSFITSHLWNHLLSLSTACCMCLHTPLSELPLLLASPRAVVPVWTASSRPSLLQLGFLMIFCTKESCVEPAERKSKDVLCSQSGSLVCWFKKGRGWHLRASEWCSLGLQNWHGELAKDSWHRASIYNQGPISLNKECPSFLPSWDANSSIPWSQKACFCLVQDSSFLWTSCLRAPQNTTHEGASSVGKEEGLV